MGLTLLIKSFSSNSPKKKILLKYIILMPQVEHLFGTHYLMKSIYASQLQYYVIL